MTNPSHHPRPEYKFAARTFRTQADVIKHIQCVLHSATPSLPLAGDEYQFVLALLQRHPWAHEKIGRGVKAIRVESEPLWGRTMMFVVDRVDGTSTDFSFMKCLRPPKPLDDFRAACRHAVANDVIEFKQDYFRANADDSNRVACPLTGASVGWTDVHVDHAPIPFRMIVDAFIQMEDLSVESVAIGGDELHHAARMFLDPDLSAKFLYFHRRVARLRVISASENLRIR